MKSNSFPNKSSGVRKKTARLRRRKKKDSLKIVKLFLAFFVLHFALVLLVLILLILISVLVLLAALILVLGLVLGLVLILILILVLILVLIHFIFHCSLLLRLAVVDSICGFIKNMRLFLLFSHAYGTMTVENAGRYHTWVL